MRIEIFGYYVHVLLFVIILAVIFAVVFGFILFRRLKERKKVYATSNITDWERSNIPKLLSAESKAVGDEQYTEKLKKIVEFIRTCDYWNNDELLEVDKDSVLILTKVLFDYVKDHHRDEPDRCVLLLHAIDNINGGIDFSTGDSWMVDDLPEIINSEEVSHEEGKVISMCQNALVKAFEKYMDLNTDRIPMVTEAIDELGGVTYDEFQRAVDDIAECEGIDTLKESTYKLTESCMIDEILGIIEAETSDYFEEYYLCYFRALACLIDRQPYDLILESLAD